MEVQNQKLMPKEFSHCGKLFQFNRTAKDFFEVQKEEGHNVAKWEWALKSPGSMPPHAMIEMAKDFRCDMGDLLSAGFGRLNKYDAIDQAVSSAGTGETLGTVQHIC